MKGLLVDVTNSLKEAAESVSAHMVSNRLQNAYNDYIKSLNNNIDLSKMLADMIE